MVGAISPRRNRRQDGTTIARLQTAVASVGPVVYAAPPPLTERGKRTTSIAPFPSNQEAKVRQDQVGRPVVITVRKRAAGKTQRFPPMDFRIRFDLMTTDKE